MIVLGSLAAALLLASLVYVAIKSSLKRSRRMMRDKQSTRVSRFAGILGVGGADDDAPDESAADVAKPSTTATVTSV